jgi:hypothetical protein
MLVATSDADTAAIALYESAGFSNREGGATRPVMRLYERALGSVTAPLRFAL